MRANIAKPSARSEQMNLNVLRNVTPVSKASDHKFTIFGFQCFGSSFKTSKSVLFSTVKALPFPLPHDILTLRPWVAKWKVSGGTRDQQAGTFLGRRKRMGGSGVRPALGRETDARIAGGRCLDCRLAQTVRRFWPGHGGAWAVGAMSIYAWMIHWMDGKGTSVLCFDYWYHHNMRNHTLTSNA